VNSVVSNDPAEGGRVGERCLRVRFVIEPTATPLQRTRPNSVLSADPPFVSVGEVGWDIQLPLGTRLHELERLGPTFNNAVYREGCRLPPLVRAVKLSSIYQGTPVVVVTVSVGFGIFPVPSFTTLYCKTAGQCLYAFFFLILGKERLHHLSCLLSQGLHSLFLFCAISFWSPVRISRNSWSVSNKLFCSNTSPAPLKKVFDVNIDRLS